MSDVVVRILAIANAYPQLGVDAARAEQIAAEAAALHAACAAAALRFPASEAAQFAALFSTPTPASGCHDAD